MFRLTASASRLLAAIRADRKAATAVEYGLILSLVVLVVMVSIIALGGQTTSMWNNVSTAVRASTGG
ncbi:Flp family type IVb pilin [Sphingomonas donggukensis]|uniref:Flp family type IVb pilin n=1 Tax=Sphingomonas donggukensis TaxID=2949093 RepID=A0ABY4TUZ1_9SPHN|nr:Flp family type IVb pilin [Sphingomonas donggukensis]URW76220.1 Flp family type IVb pilin [Sphingomonas donggukensis]